MGNNASQSNITQRQQLEQEQQQQQQQHWAHSFPRTPQRHNQQHKVLPDVTGDAHQKLRPTNNGEILYSGGTISGRHQSCLTLQKEDIQNDLYTSPSSRHVQNYNPNENNPQMRHFLHHHQQQREPMYKLSPQRNRNVPTHLWHPHTSHSMQKEMQMKRFGSVPNLSGEGNDYTNRESKENAMKMRKKYKAPAPPTEKITSNGTNLNNWDTIMNRDIADTPVRKMRLFKTRAEMKREPRNHQEHRTSIDNQMQFVRKNELNRFKSKVKEPEIKKSNNETTIHIDKDKRLEGNQRVMLADMQRSKSLPEFQAELREVTKKLRSSKLDSSKPEENKIPPPVNNISSTKLKSKNTVTKYNNEDNKENKLNTLDPNLCNKEQLKHKIKQIEQNYNKDLNLEKERTNTMDVTRSRASGKESTPEQSPVQKLREKTEQPSKTFYFGMDETAQPNSLNINVVDNFALSLQKHNCILSTQTYSGSDLSSDIDLDDSQVSTNGIALHLRPILPKKQLEIPRFSPAAAWRLLTAFDSNPPPSTVSDEGPVFIEDRIEKLARQPPPFGIPNAGPRSSYDKSGDSGISGDAGPTGFEDNSDPILPTSRNNNIQISAPHCPLNLSWTPQQDLEGEESSSEGGANNNNKHYMRSVTSKFSSRSYVFSLSLPRDNHLAAYMEEKARLHLPPNSTNLQKLKRSVSGVFGNFSGKLKDSQLFTSQDQSDNNWFLSRSAPNSLNNGINSLEVRLTKQNSNVLEEVSDNNNSSATLVKNPLNTNGGRIIYLPECEENNNFHTYKDDSNDLNKTPQNLTDSDSVNMDIPNQNKNQYRASMMSMSCENVSSGLNVMKQTFELEDLQDPPKLEQDKWKGRKPKRFTFQSTVRQIERRRLAEKLSREAERKEQQRLSELEAMRRVEAEFQRKRAKEKASIRQQLRLFSLEDNAWSNSQSNWENKDAVPTRSEPDGAVSSTASSPTMDSLMKLPESKLNDLSHNEFRNESMKKTSLQRNSTENKSNLVFKKIISRQGSESSDDTKLKAQAQATQVLSEYRQPRREYKDYRISSRLLENNDTPYHSDNKQTTIHHPQVIYNMPKAHQGSSTDGSSRSNNYRRDFAHGIMLPIKTIETYTDESQSNIRKHSPRLTQNQRTRQDKFIS